MFEGHPCSKVREFNDPHCHQGSKEKCRERPELLCVRIFSIILQCEMDCGICGVTCSTSKILARHFRQKHPGATMEEFWAMKEISKYHRDREGMRSSLCEQEAQYVGPGKSCYTYHCLKCDIDLAKGSGPRHMMNIHKISTADTKEWVRTLHGGVVDHCDLHHFQRFNKY